MPSRKSVVVLAVPVLPSWRVTHGFATTADAEAFLGGTELRDAMQQAGVQGQPRIEIYQDM